MTPTDSDANGVPDEPAASLLRAKAVTAYDERGRAYRTDTYGVDQSTGTPATTPTSTRAWYGPRGKVAKLVHPGGLVEKAAYDGVGRLATAYEMDGGGDTTYADALTVAGDAVLSQAEYAHDADGLLTLVTGRVRFDGATGTGPLGTPTTGIAARVTYVAGYYDLGRRLVAGVDVGTNGGSPWIRPATTPARSDTVLVTSYGYGTDGRPADVTGPDGVTDRTAHDALGRPTSVTSAYGTAVAMTTAYAYDAGGRLASETDPGGRTTAYGYDALERVNAVTERAGTVFERTSTVAYNRLGDVTGTADPFGTTGSVAYDVLGRVVGMTAAVGLPIERSSSQTYDALGRVLTATDPRGNVTGTTYDDVGRTVTVTSALGDSSAAGYDAEGWVTSATGAYGKTWTQGRVTSVTDPLSHATTYAYLVGGDSMSATDPLSHTWTATLDRFDRTAAATDPLAHSATFDYDRIGRVTEATDPRGTTAAYAYDALGRMTGVTEAVGEVEEWTTTYAFNSAGDLTDVTNPRGRLRTTGTTRSAG